MLHVLHIYDIMNEGVLSPGKERILMKLWYDKRVADPIYYAQQGVRNGKKVSSKNVKRIGKHWTSVVFQSACVFIPVTPVNS